MSHQVATATPKAEEKIYADVYDVLMIGMVISNVLFIAGLALALAHPHFVPLSRDYVRSSYHWQAIKEGLASFRPVTLMMLATLLLILTPVSRVLISVYAFYMGKDRKYVIVTGTVALVIALTVLLGALGLH
ncbi:MAG: DUF1634 domain-containing protein [Terriglobia bacterium]